MTVLYSQCRSSLSYSVCILHMLLCIACETTSNQTVEISRMQDMMISNSMPTEQILPDQGSRYNMLMDMEVSPAFDIENIIVSTSLGQIKGVLQNEIYTFKGIPYALPPIGTLRLKAPQAVEAWGHTLEAFDFGYICPQNSNLLSAGGEQSEDCLSLNIWTPPPRDTPYPVMVWIHGGGFVLGSSQQELYDGTQLAKKGEVIVVSLNYRLGGLGFFAHPQLSLESEKSVSGNYGILDQVMALQWVHNHIAQFGGDPQQVTLFGESAGGFSICALLASPMADDLFKQAIIQSGGGCYGLPHMDEDRVLEGKSRYTLSQSIVDDLNCSERTDLLTCLREASTEDWLTASDQVEASLLGLPQIGPGIDGEVIVGQAYDLIQTQEIPDKVIMTGANANEIALFTLLSPVDFTQYQDLVHSLFPTQSDTLFMMYPAEDDASAQQAYIDLASDLVFICSSLAFAQASAQGESVTFVYHFDHGLSNGLLANLGAAHAVEIPFVFGNTGLMLYGSSATEDDERVSEAMVRAWSSFAYTGVPQFIEGQEWKAFDREQGGVAIFAKESTFVDGIRNQRCQILQDMGLVPSP